MITAILAAPASVSSTVNSDCSSPASAEAAGPATATAEADTPNRFSNTLTRECNSSTVIFSTCSIKALNSAGISTDSSTPDVASALTSATGAAVSSTATSVTVVSSDIIIF